MERSFSSTLGSVLTATLLAGAVLLGGCSNSITGTTPPTPDQNETVKKTAEPNTNSADTDPVAGHNTSDED